MDVHIRIRGTFRYLPGNIQRRSREQWNIQGTSVSVQRKMDDLLEKTPGREPVVLGSVTAARDAK
jgi:hypothetical protein